MTAVVVRLTGCRVLFAGNRANYTTRNTLRFKLSSAATMAEFVALSLKAAGFLSVRHGYQCSEYVIVVAGTPFATEVVNVPVNAMGDVPVLCCKVIVPVEVGLAPGAI